MSTDLEQQLRGAMERFTGDVRAPPGPAEKAYRHRQKRRVTGRVAAAAGTATAVAVSLAIAGAAGAFGSASGKPVKTAYTASVVSHMEHAMASSASGSLLEQDRTVYQPGTTLRPGPTGLAEGSGDSGTGPAWTAGYSLSRSYHGTTKFSAFTATGQPVLDLGLVLAHRSLATAAVLYGSRTWWKAATGGLPPHVPASPVCVRGRNIIAGRGQDNGWPAFIRSQLACGAYTVTGHHVVDGIDAIKITGASGVFTFWVDPATYLPVQMKLGNERTTFRWLTPTPANLAQLKVIVPAGFKQVPAPPPHGR